MLKPIGQLNTADSILQRIQGLLVGAINQLNRVEILDGQAVTVTLSGTETKVEHGLGRLPCGWVVQDKTANQNVWRSGEMTARHIPLTASAAVTVTLWIF
jgi:hypothetical protein